MKKFVFRLESVLRLRLHNEQQALEQLGRCQAAHRAALGRSKAVEVEIQRAELTALETHLQAQREVYLYRLRIRLMQLKEELALKTGELELSRQRAVEAQAERKAVERLRERHLAEWQTEAQREEDRTLSEVAARRI